MASPGRFLDPVCRGDVTTLALRWEATGVTGALFPVLDADITLTPAGHQAAQLALAGSYRAPLGGLGTGLDKAILNRVATATIRALLRNVADSLASPSTAAARQAAVPTAKLGAAHSAVAATRLAGRASQASPDRGLPVARSGHLDHQVAGVQHAGNRR